MAQCGHENDIRVTRIHDDRADLLGLFEADVFPGAAGVSGFINAIAGGRVAADASLAHAGVDDIGIGFGDGERADGTGCDLTIGDREPVESTVSGFPDAASGGAEIVGLRQGRNAGDGDGAASTEGSDGAPSHFMKGIRRGLRGRREAAEGNYYER